MFSHVVLGSNNIEKSKKFYDATMQSLGYGEGIVDEKGCCLYIGEAGALGLTKPIDGQAASNGNGSTIGFIASSCEVVDEWHRVGVLNGGVAIENPPGIRGSGEYGKYMAYLRDPDGNKICVLYPLNHK